MQKIKINKKAKSHICTYIQNFFRKNDDIYLLKTYFSSYYDKSELFEQYARRNCSVFFV